MRVAISGYYGFGNLGDEALLAGLLGQLKALGAEALVLSGDPERTTAEHGVEAAHRYRGLLPALRRSDALISGGGGLLQDTTSSRSLGYYLGVLRLARMLGKKTAVYGQSIGPLSPAGRRRARRVLRHVPLAVRDEPSIELLADLGLEARMVADPALLLRPDREASEGVDVLLVPRTPWRSFSEALLAAGEEALSLGRTVGVMAIQAEEDAPEIGFLLAGLPGARHYPAGNWREAMAVTAAAGLVLSVRLHGLIFAAATGTPHAGLVYDPKVRGFLLRSGGASFEEPVDTLALLGHVQSPNKVDTDRLKQLHDSASAGADWLAQQLGLSGAVS